MKAANYETCERLQRTLRALCVNDELTTRGLRRAANIEAVSATVSELRANGHRIACKRRGKYFYYRLDRSAK